MANQNTPFSLDMEDVVLVKPLKPTPSTILSLSTLDNNPDINHLNQTIFVYQANLDHSPSIQLDPFDVLKQALSKALVFYYPFAGKLIRSHVDGKLIIKCNNADDGVPFLAATANCDLSSLHYLDQTNSQLAMPFVFNFPSQDHETGHQYPLVLQVTKFLCGGFTIGLGMHHAVSDGFGAMQFFQAMAELIASEKTEPSIKPVWEREILVGTVTKELPIQFPIDKVSSAVSPLLPTEDLLHECFKVDGESIRRIKMNLMNEISDHIETMKESFTSFESLAAYVWRSKARALKLNPHGKTMLGIVVGVRKRLLDPPLPCGYYGNAFIIANVVVSVKELDEGPLSEVVKLIKESKKSASDNDYIRNTINILETRRQEDVRNESAIGATMIISDWRQFGVAKRVDFGWKEPVNVVPVPCSFFGYVDSCSFLPSSELDHPSMKGGVRIFVSLPKVAMPKFREEMEALCVIGGA